MDDALRILVAEHEGSGRALDPSEMLALIDGLLAEIRALEAEIDGLAQGIAG